MTVDRRRFLGVLAAGGVTLAASAVLPAGPSAGLVGRAGRHGGAARLPADPFALGVASGDPAPDGVVLWTRLSQEPLAGGGMPPEDVPVRWMVGSDDALRRVVRRGRAVARVADGHAVHVVVEGLEPDRPYWYRFVVGNHESSVARTRTTPRPGARAARLDLGFASCQNFRDGYYTAWGDVAADDDLDLVVFLGDYIYESGAGMGAVRAHDVAEVVSLEEYRNRYALYRSDPLLRAAHAHVPWIVTWDDHEVDNNYQGDQAEARSPTADPAAFRARRAAAYRAWWEHMPTRLPRPDGANLAIHRTVDHGRLARFHVLDTRQYRSDQPCAPESDIGPVCDAARGPDVTVLGPAQERWLDRSLATSRAVWDVLAQQVIFSPVEFSPGADGVRNLDQWDGYPEARRRVLDAFARHRIADPVVLTGDVHASLVADVTADPADPGSPHVGTELVGTSISSSAPDALRLVLDDVVPRSPHLRWADATKRGWVRCTVTPRAWRADYRSVEDARVEGSPVTTTRSWVIEPGRAVVDA